MNRDPKVRSFRPVLTAVGINGIGFGFKETDFCECYFHGPLSTIFPHRNVAPRSSRERNLAGVRLNDLAAQDGRTTQIGPKPSPKFRRQRAAVGPAQL